jgi:hypothetical protein
MKTLSMVTAAAVAVSAALISLAPGEASAQSGSRLCGWVAVATPMKIGLLYEARKKDASYKKQCSEVIKKMEKEIKKDATLSKMSWKKIDKKACEDVGKMGLAYTNDKGEAKNDICEKMQAKKAYKVLKQGTAATTFTKL